MRLVPTLFLVACATAAPIEQRAPDREPARQELAPTEIANNPWGRSWDSVAERERLTRIGATDTPGLEKEYARLCGPSSPPTISGSPLLRYRTDSWNTHTGTVVYLSPLAGTADSLLADIRCHFVGILVSAFGLDDSPFDLPGFKIEARGDEAGIMLALTVRDPSLTGELHRRVNRQVEAAARPHHEE